MILFLDFDGVLHPDAVFLEKGRPVLKADGSLFMWSSHLEHALTSYPHVEIVLSTSWVRVRGYSRARDALPESLRQRVIGATWHSAMGRSEFGGFRLPVCWWDQATRFQQITRYVRRAQISEWVAIDDHGEAWPSDDVGNLVWTRPDVGISDPLALTQLRDRLGAS